VSNTIVSAREPATLSLFELMTAYARRSPVTSVAVVGNAPLPPDPARAAAIDAADLVIRMNSFVLDVPDGTPCQGSNVDVVVWNRITRATEFVFQDYRDRLYLLVEPMRLHGNPEAWPTSWPEDLGFVPVPNRSITSVLNEELGLPWRSERLAPTTGTMSAYLAVTLFPNADVLLTGLSYVDQPEQTRWQHQWGDSCPVGPEHRIDLEARLIRSWIADGRVRFLR
jgi:hypothetical protein